MRSTGAMKGEEARGGGGGDREGRGSDDVVEAHATEYIEPERY